MEFFWENTDWEKADLHLVQLAKAPFRRPFPEIKIGKGLYIIRGPRQVGKSSWMKTLLSKNLKAGKKCFYLSCEAIKDFAELGRILVSLRDYEIIFLDEISFVKEWARAVKTERERLNSPSIVITGSNMIDLRKGGERLPGRFGDGAELELLPMEFKEFCEMRAIAKWPELPRLELLNMYFRVGGFPSAMIEASAEGATPKNSYHTYWKWILGDIVRAGKQESYLRQLMGQLALSHCSTISLQKLAQNTQIGSHNTVLEYLQLLEDCFVIRTLYAIDPNNGTRRYRTDKKFYFRDPLIYWIALVESHQKIPDNHASQIAELVAAESLGRITPQLGYYKSKNGEVDFYSYQDWAIEVKWSPVASNISKAYESVQVAEKSVWTHSNFLSDFPRNAK